MDVYHIWCNLRQGVSDAEFATHVDAYLGALCRQGLIEGHRLCRRKLGLGPAGLGEFHVSIEIRSLEQLDRAFQHVSVRAGEVEELHAAVNQMARDLTFALYRDFPDPHRALGEEKF
jgi:HAMP domain-containing protein